MPEVSAIQVKDVPPDVHDALRLRAADEGVDMQDYILQILRRELAVPSQREWLRELRSQPIIKGLPPAADLLHDARADRGADAGRH